LEVVGQKKKDRVYGMGSEPHIILADHSYQLPSPSPPLLLSLFIDQIQQIMREVVREAMEPINQYFSIGRES